MAFKGVGTADGGGSTIFTCTELLRSCGYEVCLLMDSDLPDEDEYYSEDEDSEDEDEFYSEDEEEFYSEDYRLNKIIKYHSQNFKSNFWGHDNFNKLSDDEYYDLIGEIVDGPINEYQLPRVFLFLKNLYNHILRS